MLEVNQNSDQRYRGHVVSVNAAAGYFFIIAEDRSIDRDVFAHVSDIEGNSDDGGHGGDHLNKNEKVSFRLTRTDKGFRARLIRREA